MREQLLQILVFLRETNSWDLAENLAKWVYNLENIDVKKINSIIWFIDIIIKKWNTDEKTNNLIQAKNMMISIRDKELQEKNEEKEELENLLNF